MLIGRDTECAETACPTPKKSPSGVRTLGLSSPSQKISRTMVLEIFWDGEDNPSVRTPLGDFFGVGHAVSAHSVSLPISMVTGPRRGPKGPFAAAMNSYFPMPFGSHARVQIRNESDLPIENLFYYVDYELTQEPTPPDVGRFHAQYRQEKPCRKVVHPAGADV